MALFARHIEDLKQEKLYVTLRRLIIRISLCPIKDIVVSDLDGTKEIVKKLLSKNVIKIIAPEFYPDIILLNEKKGRVEKRW